MYLLNDYDFELPEDLIAQRPAARRDESRLLLLDRKTGIRSHYRFYQLSDLLAPGDVLVVNDTRVVPARLVGKKETGGRIEVLILDYARSAGTGGSAGVIPCECLLKTGRPARPGTRLFFDQGLSAEIGESKDGVFSVSFFYGEDFGRLLEKIGSMPLPPYIKRETDAGKAADRADYQTVYASREGAAAAPTAGLHFTRSLLEKIRSLGVTVSSVTLHVGYGTFRPVKVTDIREHLIHSEDYIIPEASAAAINLARSEGRRVVAVGTTCVRTLEYAADVRGRVTAGHGSCDLYIYPGYQFRVVDAMITNFHLPKSTLIMLASAFAGRENLLVAYREAIEKRYRFFSYGDAMMIV
jgi:S-adenosylmethionine:tRNA ribosyltransferase-isomerase